MRHDTTLTEAFLLLVTIFSLFVALKVGERQEGFKAEIKDLKARLAYYELELHCSEVVPL